MHECCYVAWSILEASHMLFVTSALPVLNCVAGIVCVQRMRSRCQVVGLVACRGAGIVFCT